MKHLTDEQMEDILAGTADEHPHLEGCALCRGRLAEHRAVRARLRTAFAGVHSSDALRQAVRTGIGGATGASRRRSAAVQQTRRVLSQVWPALAAAAVLVLAIFAGTHLSRPRQAGAAQMELVTIHQQNLSPHGEFYVQADPDKLAEYFKTHLGFEPRFPHLGEGLKLWGCCKAHFRGAIVGSYVVQTPRGMVSVIVVTDTPESLGLKRVEREGAPPFLAGAYARVKLAARQVDGYTYCVVGETSMELLADLLDRLVTAEDD